MARDFWIKGLDSNNLHRAVLSARVLWNPHESSRVVETSLTTSAVSRDTFPVQAAGAGSHKPRVGGGGRNRRRCALSDVHTSTLETSHYIKNGVAHQTSLRSRRTMMTRANSRRREAGRLFILPVTSCGRPHLHTGIPAYRPHRAVAGDSARRQNSS